ncbi:hypothetical protein [Saccharothrix sp. NRRL B-16348]|uniref:hypothetical protein n=1 Tax=Saccharothrix sp. NRRL B-16348 TaxID=1415542 RepID=UPI000A544152|nr:hypothetical protein [Saccharothrix sp. NRRL B-16348]
MPLGQQSLSAGEPWYASGTVWTIVGIVVAVVLGCWAVWAAFRSARPRRALYITVDQAVLLPRSAPGLEHRRLEASLEGRGLTTPYVVTVGVVSDSAMDSAPAMFGGAPLVLDFGVPILALLDKSSVPGRPRVRELAVWHHWARVRQTGQLDRGTLQGGHEVGGYVGRN